MGRLGGVMVRSSPAEIATISHLKLPVLHWLLDHQLSRTLLRVVQEIVWFTLSCCLWTCCSHTLHCCGSCRLLCWLCSSQPTEPCCGFVFYISVLPLHMNEWRLQSWLDYHFCHLWYHRPSRSVNINIVLSVITSVFFYHPLISKVISWQCFLTVLFLEATLGFRVTVFCLFVYYIFMLCLTNASWGFLELRDTSWSFWALPDASLCLLLLPDKCFIAFCTRLPKHQNDSKQTKTRADTAPTHGPRRSV